MVVCQSLSWGYSLLEDGEKEADTEVSLLEIFQEIFRLSTVAQEFNILLKRDYVTITHSSSYKWSIESIRNKKTP